MDLPINQAYQVIYPVCSTYSAQVYRNSIPFGSTDQDMVYKNPVVLIRESANEPNFYANNDVKRQLLGVEVQMFFNSNSGDVMKQELQVQKSMIDAGWQMTASRPHTWDPDTNWLTKTMYFEKTETLKDEDFK